MAGKGKFLTAVRHDVENLTRRGNIFYWRARIPNTFQQCRPGSRLSLSLHCSDHKKAQVIGRKLNTLLAELKMNLKEPMSKAQPDTILRLMNPEQRLLVPARADERPHSQFLHYHRERVFKG